MTSRSPPRLELVAAGDPSDAERSLLRYVADRAGAVLSPQQIDRVLATADSRRGQRGLHEYTTLVKSALGAAELAELLGVVSVLKTELFRDEAQLEAFECTVLRPLLARAVTPIHVWSAGCATGEEVATLLIMLEQAGAPPGSTVLGTDLSRAALRRAERLAFTREAMRRVPHELIQRFFECEERDKRGAEGEREGAPSWRLKRGLADAARFTPHNLMESPYPTAPSGGGFDAIFCRNVLIYLSPPAQAQVLERLTASLVHGGVLVLSASEPLLGRNPGLVVQREPGAFFYRRALADGA